MSNVITKANTDFQAKCDVYRHRLNTDHTNDVVPLSATYSLRAGLVKYYSRYRGYFAHSEVVHKLPPEIALHS